MEGQKEKAGLLHPDRHGGRGKVEMTREILVEHAEKGVNLASMNC